MWYYCMHTCTHYVYYWPVLKAISILLYIQCTCIYSHNQHMYIIRATGQPVFKAHSYFRNINRAIVAKISFYRYLKGEPLIMFMINR